MRRVSHAIDRVEVTFDDPNLVANAGLLLVGTLCVRLELERLVNTMVCLGERVGAAKPGRKVLSRRTRHRWGRPGTAAYRAPGNDDAGHRKAVSGTGRDSWRSRMA